jgi:hypothetical protein
MQDHLGAALLAIDHLDREIALAAGFPTHGLVGFETGTTRNHGDLVGDDVRGIETDAELADEVRILGLITGQRREEFAGAGLGDRSQVLDRLVARQADAVVGDGDGACFLVEGDPNPEFAVVAVEAGIVQRLEAQPVAGIRGVGDQLAQENFLVAVQRVDHQIQQLFDFCLKTKCFLLFTH